jgi:hypothetical protein
VDGVAPGKFGCAQATTLGEIGAQILMLNQPAQTFGNLFGVERVY